MQTNLFKTIGYKDIHSNAPRTCPESSTECQRFRVQLRNLDFVNPTKITSMYKSLVDENELSEQLKNFSNLAKKARENYIVEVFYNKNTTYLSKPIPITKEEAISQVDCNEILRSILAKGFGFVKYFKILEYGFSQRDQAGRDLKRSLEEIASENGELSSKAQKMLHKFDLMINSSYME
nr:14292_t:CDS:2 [Entrophospora candida]